MYASENLLVRQRPSHRPDLLVVTFDHYGITGRFDRPGFAEDFLASRGISVLTFLGRGNDWYQYPDMRDALAAARTVAAGRRRVMTYGSSMGGYAAIRFADALGAQACLALSPQYSLDPRKVPFERRWGDDANRIAWRPELDGTIRCAADPVIVYDPASSDGAHVRLIEADIACRGIALPYTAHPATTFLQSIGALAGLIGDMLDGTFDLAAAARSLDAPRKNDPIYLSELARRQPAWRPRLGVALAQRAADRSPGTDLLLHILASKLAAAGRYAEALPAHARARRLSGDIPCYALPHAHTLAQSGDLAGALALARQLAARHPGDAHIHHFLSHMLWRTKQRRKAVAVAKQAFRLSPHDPFFRSVLNQYRWSRLRLRARWAMRFADSLREQLRRAAVTPPDRWVSWYRR
ncbi:hypothetical protein ASD39_11695 [Sphingomonas sp. Root50]|nr:hypothetical protein ASD17_21890 [Sphingomonas sp. Root1294]KQY66439.1 hypothetical protein ASD39_11695 [Sphingomonas sp. Root50]